MKTSGFSLNILEDLKKRYGDWVEPTITRVRILQKQGGTFLEINYSTEAQKARVERFDLDFIADDLNNLEPLFSSRFKPQYNAERFFEDLDLFSMMMTGVGDLLFTEKGGAVASKFSGADKGKPLGDFTRR